MTLGIFLRFFMAGFRAQLNTVYNKTICTGRFIILQNLIYVLGTIKKVR